MYNECLQKGCPSMSIYLNNFWSISCSGHDKVKVCNNHWIKTVCIRLQKLVPFSFNDFQCFHFLLLTSNDGWKPQSVKTTLMLLQHFGAKLTSSFYTDSDSTSQHLKNVSFRSYDLAYAEIIESSKSFNWLNIIMIHGLCRFFLVTVHSPPRNQNTEHIRLAANCNPDHNGRCVFCGQNCG